MFLNPELINHNLCKKLKLSPKELFTKEIKDF